MLAKIAGCFWIAIGAIQALFMSTKATQGGILILLGCLLWLAIEKIEAALAEKTTTEKAEAPLTTTTPTREQDAVVAVSADENKEPEASQ